MYMSMGNGGGVKVRMFLVCVIVSSIVSAITTKILVTYYYKIVDDHVAIMCDMTIKFVSNILEQRMHEKNFDREG